MNLGYLAKCRISTARRRFTIANTIHAMSPYTTLFAYFGVYILFMLVFFIIICLVCLMLLLWYNRKYNLEATLLTEPRENTPIRRPCQGEF